MSGDFVSREALKQALTDKFKSRIGASRIPTWNDAFDAVTNLPSAADVMEVRHGRWISKNSDGSWRVDTCSVCGKDTHYVRYAPAYDYCLNCGAKMDGGQE